MTLKHEINVPRPSDRLNSCNIKQTRQRKQNCFNNDKTDRIALDYMHNICHNANEYHHYKVMCEPRGVHKNWQRILLT